MPTERPACPAPGCQGHLETVVSNCRPGEVDASTRCDGCGRVQHVVLDEQGQLLDEAALAKHRGAETKPVAEPSAEA